jgi:hypothetical protein
VDTISSTIELLQAECDRLIALLDEVTAGYVDTGRDDVALILIPLDLWLEVERATGDSALARQRAAFLAAGFVLRNGAWCFPTHRTRCRARTTWMIDPAWTTSRTRKLQKPAAAPVSPRADAAASYVTVTNLLGR